MKKIVVLVFLVATFSIAGYASSACLNSVFLNQMDGGGFTCYIAGGGGFPDVLFSNFAYTPTGGAPPDTLVTVSLNSNFTGGYEQAGFAFNPTNGWQVGQGFTLSYTAAICTSGCLAYTPGNYSFYGATAQENTFLSQSGLVMTNSFGSLNLSTNDVTQLLKTFGRNPSGWTTGTYSIFYNGGSAITLNSFEGDVYVQDAVVPEPMTMLLAGGGLLALGLVARKRRKV